MEWKHIKYASLTELLLLITPWLEKIMKIYAPNKIPKTFLGFPGLFLSFMTIPDFPGLWPLIITADIRGGGTKFCVRGKGRVGSPYLPHTHTYTATFCNIFSSDPTEKYKYSYL